MLDLKRQNNKEVMQ